MKTVVRVIPLVESRVTTTCLPLLLTKFSCTLQKSPPFYSSSAPTHSSGTFPDTNWCCPLKLLTMKSDFEVCGKVNWRQRQAKAPIQPRPCRFLPPPPPTHRSLTFSLKHFLLHAFFNYWATLRIICPTLPATGQETAQRLIHLPNLFVTSALSDQLNHWMTT